jgi:hypothetical protein
LRPKGTATPLLQSAFAVEFKPYLLVIIVLFFTHALRKDPNIAIRDFNGSPTTHPRPIPSGRRMRSGLDPVSLY